MTYVQGTRERRIPSLLRRGSKESRERTRRHVLSNRAKRSKGGMNDMATSRFDVFTASTPLVRLYERRRGSRVRKKVHPRSAETAETRALRTVARGVKGMTTGKGMVDALQRLFSTAMTQGRTRTASTDAVRNRMREARTLLPPRWTRRRGSSMSKSSSVKGSQIPTGVSTNNVQGRGRPLSGTIRSSMEGFNDVLNIV